RLAKLDFDGQVVPGWRANPDGGVRALALYGDDLYVGGAFGSIEGKHRDRLARVSASTGTVDDDFAPVLWNTSVFAISAHGDRLLVGGQFVAADIPRGRSLASYALAGDVDVSPTESDFGRHGVDEPPSLRTFTLVNGGHAAVQASARIAGG